MGPVFSFVLGVCYGGLVAEGGTVNISDLHQVVYDIATFDRNEHGLAFLLRLHKPLRFDDLSAGCYSRCRNLSLGDDWSCLTYHQVLRYLGYKIVEVDNTWVLETC